MGWSRRVLPAHAHSAAWDLSPPGPSCPEPGASLTQCILARPSHLQQGGGLVVAVGGRERNRIGRTDRMPLTTANYSAATFNWAPFLQPHPRTPLEPPSVPRMSLRRLPAHRSYSPASSHRGVLLRASAGISRRAASPPPFLPSLLHLSPEFSNSLLPFAVLKLLLQNYTYLLCTL